MIYLMALIMVGLPVLSALLYWLTRPAPDPEPERLSRSLKCTEPIIPAKRSVPRLVPTLELARLGLTPPPVPRKKVRPRHRLNLMERQAVLRLGSREPDPEREFDWRVAGIAPEVDPWDEVTADWESEADEIDADEYYELVEQERERADTEVNGKYSKERKARERAEYERFCVIDDATDPEEYRERNIEDWCERHGFTESQVIKYRMQKGKALARARRKTYGNKTVRLIA